jgi:hypothetical protein
VFIDNYALPVTYAMVAEATGMTTSPRSFVFRLYDKLSGPLFPQLGGDCFTLFSFFKTPQGWASQIAS